jgi:hypothetical protein
MEVAIHMGMWQGLMEASGFPTSFKLISGQVPDTGQKGQAMSFTVIESVRTAVLFAVLSASAGAAERTQAPQFVQDPILGLRLPLSSAHLDTLPEEIRGMCAEMADSDTWTGRQWIFGTVAYSTTTYYLASGYFQRRHPQPGQPLYFQPDGGIYQITDGKCHGDPARETFDVRDFRQIPQEVLQQLASDLVTRLVRTVGGPDQLRAEINNRHIDLLRLSPEVQEALQSYIAPLN